jgi:hypothetical protein
MAYQEVSGRGATRPPRPAFYNDPLVRAIFYQLALIAAVVALGWYLVNNTLENMARQGIAGGFGFLHREAAFEISEKLIEYSPSDTYGRAFLVGILNTLQVAVVGIVLATIWGTVLGIARLSSNWLIRKLALCRRFAQRWTTIAATMPTTRAMAIQSCAGSAFGTGKTRPRLERKTPGRTCHACRGPGTISRKNAHQKRSWSGSGMLRKNST